MTLETPTTFINCPFCRSGKYSRWAEELGFIAVRCNDCALIYVNPRPVLESINAAVRTGSHGEGAHQLNVVARPSAAKIGRYRNIFRRIFDDVWRDGKPISWLDVGAGYGEIVEAVTELAHAESRIEGLEPMHPKAAYAIARGLTITEDYLRPTHPKVQYVSIVDVFSHIPDFEAFLSDVKSVLETSGEIFLETGNLADLENRDEFPGELGLPDHLVFAGQKQLCGFIQNAGFEIVRIEKIRVDGVVNLIKNVVKKIIGRPAMIRLPYTSKYRQLLIRARLQNPTP